MPTYVSLFKFTDQGMKNVKGTVDRTKQSRAAIEKAGGRMAAIYWTQGQYDLVAISEWPDEEAAMAFILQLGMAGNVRMETLRAFDEAAMQRILAKVP
ncbi:MAG TPA: GYD domain-containing protein [Vicinamibacterales bacterium]